MILTNDNFVDEFIKNYPAVKDILLDEDWLNSINLQLGALRNHIELLIEQRQVDQAFQLLKYIDLNLSRANEKLINSIAVSLLEHVNEPTKNIIKSSFPNLNELLINTEEYNNKIASDVKLRKFFDDLSNSIE